jgi:hypothetical protein
MLHVSGSVSIEDAIRAEHVRGNLPSIPACVTFVDPACSVVSSLKRDVKWCSEGEDAEDDHEVEIDFPCRNLVTVGCAHMATMGEVVKKCGPEPWNDAGPDFHPLQRTDGSAWSVGSEDHVEPPLVADESYFLGPILQQVQVTLFRHMPVRLQLVGVSEGTKNGTKTSETGTPLNVALGAVEVVVLDSGCGLSGSFEGGKVMLRARTGDTSPSEPKCVCDGEVPEPSPPPPHLSVGGSAKAAQPFMEPRRIRYRYAAMAGSIVYEVTPVTAGVRVGLVYAIVARTAHADPTTDILLRVGEDSRHRFSNRYG